MPVSDDAFLGGALRILQPLQGYRAGLDAVFLGASVTRAAGDRFTALDVGAGAGTAGLCLAWRCREARVVLLEREPDLVALAEENVARNGLSDRVRVVRADVGGTANAELAALGLAENAFDCVIANPPYHVEGAGTLPQTDLKARAHAMPADGLDTWCRFMARMTRAGGEALVIHKADALPELLDGFKDRFGAICVQPLHPRAGEHANRVIVFGRKGSRAPLRIAPGLILHDADNRATRGAVGVLRLGLGVSVAYGDPSQGEMAPNTAA
jgi:FkbM family methyltransferase